MEKTTAHIRVWHFWKWRSSLLCQRTREITANLSSITGNPKNFTRRLMFPANDVEMDRLDDLYQQAVDSGWL